MPAPKPLPPLHVLREQLSYDPLTGVFTRLRQNTRWTRAGEPAGHECATHGYRFVHVLGYGYYRAHRVAWYLYYGQKPPRVIDHRNQIRSDNRIANLRESSHAKNMLNKRVYSNNGTGYRGVCYKPSRDKWVAQITYRGSCRYLGVFDSPEEAHKAYLVARLALTGVPPAA